MSLKRSHVPHATSLAFVQGLCDTLASCLLMSTTAIFVSVRVAAPCSSLRSAGAGHILSIPMCPKASPTALASQGCSSSGETRRVSSSLSRLGSAPGTFNCVAVQKFNSSLCNRIYTPNKLAFSIMVTYFTFLNSNPNNSGLKFLWATDFARFHAPVVAESVLQVEQESLVQRTGFWAHIFLEAEVCERIAEFKTCSSAGTVLRERHVHRRFVCQVDFPKNPCSETRFLSLGHCMVCCHKKART